MSTQFPASAFRFLQQLEVNNNREWFTANKDVYQHELENVEHFTSAMLQALNAHDVIETPSARKSLYRIYRDVRFSKDKSPYKTHFGGHFTRAGKQRRGGYYFQFQPGDQSHVFCAFWNPAAPDLKLIRDDIAFDPQPLRTIITADAFVKTFGTLQGEQLQRIPKGYDATHEAADLLRHKQFVVMHRLTDQDLLRADCLQQIDAAFKNMRPFLDYMSEVLSTDVNGINF